MMEPATCLDTKMVWRKESRPSTKGLSYSLPWTLDKCKCQWRTPRKAVSCYQILWTQQIKEIVSLTKFFPKRENLLEEIKENLERPESEAKGIIGLCLTRWTVRASCFSANPGQLRSSSSGVDNFPWWETPVRYTWKDHRMPSTNKHFWILLRVEFRRF